MLSVSWDTIRLFLHVLAATIWVGGQLVLAALVPVLRRFGSEAVTAVARQFNRVAWAAFVGTDPHRDLEHHGDLRDPERHP